MEAYFKEHYFSLYFVIYFPTIEKAIIFIKFKVFDHMKINIWSDNIQALINISFSTAENDSVCFSISKHGRLSTSNLLL